MRHSIMILIVLLSTAFGAAAQDDDRPWDEQPFLGLSVRDTDDGLVVGWVYPGPLGGSGFDSASGVKRGDNLVSINGQTVDAGGFKDLVSSLAVGDEVSLVLRRSADANPDASVPKGGQGGEPFTVTVALGSRDQWSGTIRRGLGNRTIPDPGKGEFEAMILDRARQVGILDADGGVAKLLDYLIGIQNDNLDPNALPAVVNAFRRPLSVDAVEAAIAGDVRGVGEDQNGSMGPLLRRFLQVNQSESDGKENSVRSSLPGGLHAMTGPMQAQRAAQARRLVRALRDSVYIFDQHAGDSISLIRSSPDLYQTWISPALWALESRFIMVPPVGPEGANAVPVDDLPESIRRAVKGDVLSVVRSEDGTPVMVVGGPGHNEYDMDHLPWIYDVGGNDVYRYTTAGNVTDSIVIDVAGNDLYESTADFAGPGTAVFGVSILDDRAGNDTYRSTGQFSIGAGLFGIGILIDRAGNDVYENVGPKSGWSMGVGFYGAGLIIDQGGSDVYLGEKLCQGVGGPRGFGAIIDRAGNDLYRANGSTFGSVYGTPAVYVGMSQGFGYGIRGYAAGGVGAIYDLGGNDRYEAGEFSQAGGYYFGMGILHDFAGNDLYYANRYGQAFAAHQAIGILIDDAGDDTYWSMTAASQAGTWDQSIGFLIDRAGSDSYRCDGLGQGGASMQAIAILLDLGGDDRYSANPGSTLGQGGGNSYHYNADHVFSFSGLLDLGGGADIYSRGGNQPARTNGVMFKTGQLNEGTPENSSLYGLFVDE